MKSKQKHFFNVIRSVSDGEIYEILDMIYDAGYIDGYNGNDVYGAFDSWLKKYYDNNITVE